MERSRHAKNAAAVAMAAMLSLVLGAACGSNSSARGSDGGSDSTSPARDAGSDRSKPTADGGRGTPDTSRHRPETSTGTDGTSPIDASAGDTGPAPIAGLRLFFSDLESGPNTGGQNGKGAFVTLYGNGFG